MALPSSQRKNTFWGDRKRVVKHPHENRLGFLFPIMNQLYFLIWEVFTPWKQFSPPKKNVRILKQKKIHPKNAWNFHRLLNNSEPSRLPTSIINLGVAPPTPQQSSPIKNTPHVCFPPKKKNVAKIYNNLNQKHHSLAETRGFWFVKDPSCSIGRC